MEENQIKEKNNKSMIIIILSIIIILLLGAFIFMCFIKDNKVESAPDINNNETKNEENNNQVEDIKYDSVCSDYDYSKYNGKEINGYKVVYENSTLKVKNVQSGVTYDTMPLNASNDNENCYIPNLIAILNTDSDQALGIINLETEKGIFGYSSYSCKKTYDARIITCQDTSKTMVMKDNLYGIVSTVDFSIIVPVKYKSIKVTNDKYIVSNNNLYGIVGKNDKELLEVKYDKIMYLDSYYLVVAGNKLVVKDNNMNNVEYSNGLYDFLNKNLKTDNNEIVSIDSLKKQAEEYNFLKKYINNEKYVSFDLCNDKYLYKFGEDGTVTKVNFEEEYDYCF